MTPSIAVTHPGAKTAAGADHVRWLVLFMKRCVHFYTPNITGLKKLKV